MNRIQQRFDTLKREHKTAFIGFLTAGDPDMDTSRECILEMERNGCDIIEIGIPFSDPCAEGPVIQEASVRALQHGYSSDDIMEMVKQVREVSQIPLVFLLYYNQIFAYGCEAFLRSAHNCDIDALIIPDLPYEHRDELMPLAKQYGITLISLVTPASGKRKAQIASESEGFLYCVTSMGVTGMRDQFSIDLRAFISELNTYSDTPKALGFGISTVEQIKEMKQYADGIIVGSAIVHEIGKLSDGNHTVQDIGAFVRTLADAAHN